ncbi:MAG: methyltransferase domain-containing protein [Clostridia bacterium]|nr:methyltransferase domain-containing protein [Clostridia bacterium]
MDERYELRNARYLAADAIQRLVQPGDTVVDATMGNGGDTLFLCRLVGEKGHVYAIDIQMDAMKRTKERLDAEGLGERVSFSLQGHQHLREIVKTPVQAVMFNLGWLPGGNHECTTHVETTIEALRQATEMILPGGMVSVCVYPGHDEGTRELSAVESFCSELPVNRYTVLANRFVNARQGTPQLFLIQKNRIQPPE